MTATAKPYAGNDLGLEAMRAAGWIRTLATWSRILGTFTEDTMALEAASALVRRDLDRLVWREFFHPLGPVEVKVARSHADFFVRGESAILAEVRGIALRIPPEIFPYVELFPRMAELGRKARRTATIAEERLRRAWRALRGREVSPWD